MIVLTSTGLVAITALPGQPEAPWCMVRANRALDLASLLPGAPVTDTGASEQGWQFATVVPREMVAEGLARCVESAAYPHMASAVPVQDRQLADLAQGIMAIAADLAWEPPTEDSPAGPANPADSPQAQPATNDAPPAHQPQWLIYDAPLDDRPVPQPQPTYDGPSPVTTTEDPFDALYPAQPTLCQLQAPEEDD